MPSYYSTGGTKKSMKMATTTMTTTTNLTTMMDNSSSSSAMRSQSEESKKNKDNDNDEVHRSPGRRRRLHSQRRHGRKRGTFSSFFLFAITMIAMMMITISHNRDDVSNTSNGHVTKFHHVAAWEWEDFVVGGGGGGTSRNTDSNNNDAPLTHDEVREMRVRDLKWRLKRRHGYSAEEVGRMIDKKDLIRALIREEDKQRSKERAAFQRYLFWRAVGFTIVAVVVVMGWPVWTHVWEVGNVNLTVYIDRKWLEAKRCVEYKSFWGMVGVVLMGIVDCLQLWMSLSILATWLITRTPQNSHWFFPIPNLPLRPGQFMGDKVANGPLGGYGLNIAPMAIGWAMRFVQAQLEGFTGRSLSKARTHQRKEADMWRSDDDKAARKEARKAARKAAKEELRQKQEEERLKELQRRKEAAEKATADLFQRKPKSSTYDDGTNNQNIKHNPSGFTGSADDSGEDLFVFHDESFDDEDSDDAGDRGGMGKNGYTQSHNVEEDDDDVAAKKKKFESTMEALDINGLD
mmetsp:Transcript_45517/g.110748  ORF Transcript_45517/g.110748 Transcript_45517/m.110748 type:complete len:517 (-) Transcript_45517:37-1587(-)